MNYLIDDRGKLIDLTQLGIERVCDLVTSLQMLHKNLSFEENEAETKAFCAFTFKYQSRVASRIA